jgi:2-polyprenyl-6-methoxyphenol hydroxylase-like FAD-dependent oxidoreductase
VYPPNSDDDSRDEASLMVSVSWPRTPSSPDLDTVDNLKSVMLEQVRGWHPGYTALVELLSKDDMYVVHHRASTRPKKTWRQDAQKQDPSNPCLGHPRVWFLGDAIHPMLPARGMGANQALHDCADALPLLLGLAEKSSVDVSGTEMSWRLCWRTRRR